MSMDREKSLIKTLGFSCDGFVLRGTLHLPAADRPPVVIGSHGLYSSGNSPKQIALAQACNRFGVAFFRFDHRGCASSQGDFDEVTSLEARSRDLTDAVKTIRNRSDTGDRIGLFGSSMGGTVCLNVAGRLDIAAMVTFAAPICSQLLENQGRQPQHDDKSEIFLDRQKRPFDLTDRLAEIGNILIVHGEADSVVPVSHAVTLFEMAKDPKKLIVQPHGDHLMSNEAHQKAFVKEAVSWLKSGLSL
jgi:alpha-beta hydrolase superfamily lysophospholipase